MTPLGTGIITGVVCSGVVGAAVAAFAYRRFILLERRTRAAERLAELGSLTSGLAHEIKNPLSTVQLNLQLLSEELDVRDPVQKRMRHRLGVVQRETGRLRDILDDFLRYAGKIEVERRPTDLNELVDELVDFFAPQAQLQRVQVRVRKWVEPLVVSVDAKLIKQALLNLSLNAVQAMTGGGELILETSVSAGEARIDVIDTAGGIAPDKVAHIFDAYYSTKKGGTGLGLAISQRVAREHGGELRVKTEMGKGSDFYLLLPMRA